MKQTLSSRFWSKVDVSGGYWSCWEWTGGTDKDGYGSFSVCAERGKRVRRGAHRVSFEMANGTLPKGREPDHLCRNRKCVNPLHMESVTTAENILRSNCPAAHNRIKTHCPRGHEYTSVNTYFCKKGKRNCRACWHRKKEDLTT